MKQKTLLIILILLQIKGITQDLKKEIQDKISTIRTISPLDTNFSDLAPLKIAIGNSRVVMLGEQDHGDAPTFLAKTRIVKYLHEEMEFDIIAFESDFYSLNQSKQSIDEVKGNIYSIWTNCAQNDDLFSYIDNQLSTNSGLVVTGFDSRHSAVYSDSNYVKDFDSLLASTNIPYYSSSNYELFEFLLLDIIEKEYQSKTDKIEQDFFFKALDSIKVQLNQIQFSNKDFWIHEISNLKGHTENAWENGVNLKGGMNVNIRDKQMGENLLWLILNKYPDKKIIVWAHNAHIAKNINQMELYKQNITSGNVVYERIGDQMYTLGFDSYSGKAGRVTGKNKSYNIKKPKKDCFENWIKEKELEYAFINFRTFTNKDIFFTMKGFSHYPEDGNWANIYDGIFYIEKMYKCDKKE
jgi:erythromycin esterase